MTYIDPRLKIFQHLDKLAAIQRGEVVPPVNVEIDLSNRCNLGCEWCHFAHTHTRGPLASKQKPERRTAGGDLMDFDLIRLILSELADYGVKSITWTGGGEPMTHPRFEDAIDFAAVLGLEQGIYTNGTLITPERADMMKDVFEWVYISLDECTAEKYTRSKRTPIFDQACAGAKNLAQTDGKATVGLGFLLHEYNYQDTDDMIALGESLGVDYVQFRPIIEYDHDAPGAKIAEAKMSWIGAAVRRLKAYEGTPGVEVDTSRFEMYANWNGHGYDACQWSNLQAVITPNGKVWTCVNKREVPGEDIGDMQKENFAAIWKRHKTARVNGQCRIMCRGHIPNTELDKLMHPVKHKNFI